MTMKSLLHALWDGAVRPCPTGQAQSLEQILSHFVPVDCVLLTIDEHLPEPGALPEDLQLLHGVSLGDAIAEELDIQVPYGAVVLIRHDAALEDLSHAAGRAVAELTVAMVSRAPLPAARRDAVLMELAALYATRAADDAVRAMGIDHASFCRGMSDLFRAHWARAHTARGQTPRTDAARRPAKTAARFPQPRLSLQDWSAEIGARYTQHPRASRSGDLRTRIN